MSISKKQLAVLMSPIHSSRVATRSQGGTNLSYVEAYDIKATLIRVFGFGGFSAEVIDSKIVSVRENQKDKNGRDKTPQVIAQSTVQLTIYGIGPDGRDAVYTETAVGANSGWDIGETADNAIKSAASDALKRCATYLGTQFGLSLYNKGSKQELVGVLFHDEQAQMLDEVRAEQQAQISQQAQEQLSKALGAKPVEA